MKIKSAVFVKSSAKLEECPKGGMPEYAFIGRSNVGKSSLVNRLANISKLSFVSATPGKTQLINHFLINGSWYMVDLPGYGYARVSKKSKSAFSGIISSYLSKRTELTCLFVLIDIRLEPQPIDLEFIHKVGEAAIPFVLLFTKSDKLSETKVKLALQRYQNTLLETWEELPPIFVTSAETGRGRDEVLDFIHTTNQTFQKNTRLHD